MKYNYKDYIADVKDFPIEGILFRDVTPLLAEGEVFKQACEELAEFAKEVNADVVAGPESRGFIFGCPVATILNVGFVPIRKPNKLPRETEQISYSLEYGTNTLCIHKDAIKPGQRVLLVDDLLATGGTIKAAADLIEKLGGIVAGICFIVELEDLNGKELIKKYNIKSLVKY